MQRARTIRQKKHVMPYESKKSLAGFLFVSIWVIGFIFFFLLPFLQSVRYSFSDIVLNPNGGYTLNFIGWKNYIKAFTTDAEFLPAVFSSLGAMLYQVPIIVLFSLFVAIILNQKFVGRTFVRGIFFIPIIVANGVILSIMNGDVLSQTIMQGSSSSTLFQSEFLYELMFKSGMSQEFVNGLTGVVDSLFALIWKSGIQIIIFLAGLQTIADSMYEAAKIEGATGWETFWKITFPMISPMIILNLIFTIIDSFTDYNNVVMKYINEQQIGMRLAYSSTLGWIYFLMVAVIIVMVYLIINKRVFYQV
ncbi:ABC transporter permease subunit [Clostridia bacterium]|jgi:lactose ABC transporter permease